MESKDDEYRISFRKEILDVLKESGNEHCIPTIMTVKESDVTIAKYFEATINVISNRYKKV
jgi:hypothetical protein